MSTKSSIIYIYQDGSHIYYESNNRAIINGQEHSAIEGVIDKQNIKSFDSYSDENVFIYLTGNMAGIFKNDRIHFWANDLLQNEIDVDGDYCFEIRPGSSLADYFLSQLINI